MSNNSPTICLRQLQRGPTSKLIFTIMRCRLDSLSINYDQTVTIDNLVSIIFKFEKRNAGHELLPTVRMKKKEGVQTAAVPIKIQCGIFEEEYYCSAQWIHVELNPVSHISSRSFAAAYQNLEPYLYVVEINVIVQFEPPKLMLPLKDLYDDETTDFQLRTADGTVAVHKAVLFLHSNMFKLMFTRDWKESTEGRISMDGITVETLQHLKDYMYLGVLPDKGLEPLLQVAAHYFMDKLRADCSEKLLETVKAENVDDLIALACGFNIPELVRALIFRVPDDVLNSMRDLEINSHVPSNEMK